MTKDSPFPTVGYRRHRDLQVIRAIQRRHPVEVLCFDSIGGRNAFPRDLPVTLVAPGQRSLVDGLLQALTPSDLPPPISQPMIDTLRDRSRTASTLWISQLEMAAYVPVGKALGMRVILDVHRVASDSLMDEASSGLMHWGGAFVAKAVAIGERRFARQADAIAAASRTVTNHVQRIARETPVSVIPDTVMVDDYRALRSNAGTTVLLPGMMDRPQNVQAAVWMAEEIVPRLRAQLTDSCPRFVVAGRNPSHGLRAVLQKAGIELHADPDALRPEIGEAAIVVLPLKSGRAAHLRALEAMAAGRPIVATGRALDGLQIAPTHDVFIADAPDAFASLVLKLWRDPAFRAEAARKALATVEKHHDFNCLPDLIENLIRAPA